MVIRSLLAASVLLLAASYAHADDPKPVSMQEHAQATMKDVRGIMECCGVHDGGKMHCSHPSKEEATEAVRDSQRALQSIEDMFDHLEELMDQ